MLSFTNMLISLSHPKKKKVVLDVFVSELGVVHHSQCMLIVAWDLVKVSVLHGEKKLRNSITGSLCL